MLSRTTTSARDLALNMLETAAGTLHPSEIAALRNSTEKESSFSSSSGTSSYRDDIAGSISLGSSRYGSIAGPSGSYSMRDTSPSTMSLGSSEAEEDYRSFLEPIEGIEAKQQAPNWIANYSNSRALFTSFSYQDRAEAHSLLNDPAFVLPEQSIKQKPWTFSGPGEVFPPSNSHALQQHDSRKEQIVSTSGHLQDGAGVIALLNDPEFSPLFDPSSPTIEEENAIAPEFFIPPSAQLFLENNLKPHLPTPPNNHYRSLSPINPLNLCFSCFTASRPDDDRWLEVNRRYMEDVWLDEDLFGSRPPDETVQGRQEDGHLEHLSQAKAKVVDRLRLTLAHLTLPVR
ncbi:MAG: hypothetical protein M1816_006904 [Peltula sp. TS41687]|nr:MAG: hypothetical protein M1816_006904 [Peltula sp. TS41687]